MPHVELDTTPEDSLLIRRIIYRYARLSQRRLSRFERLTLEMDLAATHLNGCPLRLEALLKDARDFDVVHDVVGINGHIDRSTGKLTNHFLPRYADREARNAGT